MNMFTFDPTRVASLRRAILVCIAACLIIPCSIAQTAGTGSIQGAVTDATGAVIPGANVAVTNTATQVKHTAVTGSNGSYSFPNLDIGTYIVSVAARDSSTTSNQTSFWRSEAVSPSMSA